MAGVRWCPDTREAHEVFDEILPTIPSNVHVTVVELSRTEWKENPGKDHFLRKAPFEVQSIPTLLKFDAKNQKVGDVFLQDSECCQMERIKSLLTES